MIETMHFQLLLATFAGWVGGHQAGTIAYLIEENRVLKEELESGGRLCLPKTHIADERCGWAWNPGEFSFRQRAVRSDGEGGRSHWPQVAEKH